MAKGPFTIHAGKSFIPGAKTDRYGNPQGSQYDLGQDGAFQGENVIVLQFYNFEFKEPEQALKQKGFNIIRYQKTPPTVEELQKQLKDASQIWVISDSSPKLSTAHVDVIERFFNSGRGVYIWGDNSPFYADANVLGKRLLNTTMTGNVKGDQVVKEAKDRNSPGFIQHQITTGLTHLYEGITIATVATTQDVTSTVRGSANNCVTAIFDKDGKRAIIDGGFTRLYNKWDTAGTGRFVKNAAVWLVNWERFNPPREPITEEAQQSLKDFMTTIREKKG